MVPSLDGCWAISVKPAPGVTASAFFLTPKTP